MVGTAGKVITCRAAVAWNANEPLSIEEVEVGVPKKGEVRVKIMYTAVCHSDVHAMLGNLGSLFPQVLGHEAAGIVESVGEGVTQFKEGDHVIPLYCPQCKDCEGCHHPGTNLCEKMDPVHFTRPMNDGTTRFTCKGQQLYHFLNTSTFSEYTVLQEYCLAKINPACPLDCAALIGCGIATGYGAAFNTAKVAPNSKCVVFGLGAVGLAAVMGAKNAGARVVCAVDINPDKFEKAKHVGATHCINPRDCPEGTSFEDWIISQFDGAFDHAIECIGNVTCMKQAVGITRKGWGICAVIGIAPPSHKLELTPALFIQGKTVTGSLFGGWHAVDDTPKLVDEHLEGKIDVDSFITGRGTLETINEAVERIKKGDGIRTVIKMFRD